VATKCLLEIVQSLVSNFSALSRVGISNLNPYHPALSPLYNHFATMLCDICFPFTQNPQELQYIAAARWPGFCKPLIDEHKQKIRKSRANEDHGPESDVEMDDGDEYLDTPFLPPNEDVRMRLTKLFTTTLTVALESLLPRLTNASDWALANEPAENALGLSRGHVLPPSSATDTKDEAGVSTLPRMSKFILLASFLASTNPPSSDLRMFGRGLDERKRKRRARKTTARGGGPPAKVHSSYIIYSA